MTEKRAKGRRKTLLHGFVYYDGNPCAVECVVREISDAGARLQFDLPPATVKAFELDIPLRGHKLRAEAKWQRGKEVGVVFARADEAPLVPAPPAPEPVSLEDLGRRLLRLETEFAALRRMVKQLQVKINNEAA